MSSSLPLTTVVVPCFNEEARLDEEEFHRLAKDGLIGLLFVDDGSTDGTAEVLERMAGSSEAIDVLRLESNMGKAEAVRRGLLIAIRRGATIVGYYDADLATPTVELERLVNSMESRPELAGAFGCRVSRLGSSISRSVVRHYVGRVYATLASVALGTSIYDTQCGAKLFRVTPSLVPALAQPFRSAWSFDVELLDRLLRGTAGSIPVPANAFVEMPLESWHDVEGSKMTAADAARAFMDLVRMTYRRCLPERGGGSATTSDCVYRSPPRPRAARNPLSGKARSSVQGSPGATSPGSRPRPSC